MRPIILRDGTIATVERTADGVWLARHGTLSATGATARQALAQLHETLGPYTTQSTHPAQRPFAVRANSRFYDRWISELTWQTDPQTPSFARLYTGNEMMMSLSTVDGGWLHATGPDARTAYRAACRAQRLARHTVPDLLRERDGLKRALAISERKIADDGALQLRLYDEMGRLRARNVELARESADLQARVADLERQAGGESLGDDLVAIITTLTAERDEAQRAVQPAYRHRRARHAAAIRARRELRQAWRDLSAEVEALRQQLDEAREERERWHALYSSASQSARQLALIQSLIAPQVQALQLPDVHDVEAVVRALLERARRMAEYQRRATAAEAEAEQLRAGQQRLVAAATASGLQYTVVDGRMSFVHEASDGQLEAH